MKALLSNNYLLLFFLIMLTIAVNLFSSKRYYPNPPALDSFFYEQVAKSLMEGESTIIEENKAIDIGNEVTPGYSAFVAIIYKISGEKPLHVYLVQILLNILTVLMAFEIMRKATNQIIAFLFSIILIFYFPLWKMNYDLMMEILTVFVFMLTIYYLFIFFRERKNKYLYIVALLFGILVFINNRFVIHFGILVLFMVFFPLFAKGTSLKSSLILIIVFTLTMLPWHIRQAYHYRQFIIFTPTWTNLINQTIPVVPKVNVPTDLDHPDHLRTYEDYLGTMSFSKRDTVDKKYISAYFTREKYNALINEHPKYTHGFYKYFSRLTAFWQVSRTDFQWGPGGDCRILPPLSKATRWINLIVLLPMFISMFIGAVFAFIKKDYFFQLLFYFITGHCILHVLIHYVDRYRLTVIPVIFMLAWYGIYQVYNYILFQYTKHRNIKTISI